MSVLEVKELCHTFGDAPLFNNAEMELFGGDKMGLTGLNGAGKSTFINMLTGKLLPDKGQIKFNHRLRLGYIDQQLSIGSALSVREFLRTAFAEAYEANANMQKAFSEIANSKDEERIAELNEQCGEWQQILDR
ncbi:MAG TPA: ATP-binding cassette domain-containing protein, partial [Clostridiales bacterium]|nr:ATP-binding cassette domain-containing protein [Clostridiales bacterium]